MEEVANLVAVASYGAGAGGVFGGKLTVDIVFKEVANLPHLFAGFLALSHLSSSTGGLCDLMIDEKLCSFLASVVLVTLALDQEVLAKTFDLAGALGPRNEGFSQIIDGTFFRGIEDKPVLVVGNDIQLLARARRDTIRLLVWLRDTIMSVPAAVLVL